MGTTLEDAGLSVRRRRAVRGGLGLLGALLVADVLAATTPLLGGHAHLSSHGVLDESLTAVAAALILGRAALVRQSRAVWLLLGLALAVSFAADLYFRVVVDPAAPRPQPSLADVGWLAFYPLAWVAMALLVRSKVQDWPASAWLDGLVASCGISALAMATVFADALRVRGTGPAVIAVAYPVGDLVMLVFVIGALAVLARRSGPVWWLLGAGLVCFTLGDALYLAQTSTGTYAGGGLLDRSWTIGFTLIALAAWVRDTVRPARPMDDWVLLAVPSLFALVSVALLMTSRLRDGRSEAWVVALAGAALCLALARTALTFGEVRSLTEARHLLRTDELTGLPNRRAFLEHLGTITPRYALLLLDLDRFKEVNDSFGHPVGDELLCLVGPRIAGALEDIGILARLGGDEFGLLLVGADRAAANRAAVEVKVALREAFVLDGMSLHVDASIGIALAPEHGTAPAALLRGADLAMYEAKRDGAGASVYTPGRASSARQRLQTLEELRSALDHDELVVHFQPKLELATGRVVGAEALVRWEHPVRGLIYPDAFLPLAEQAGLMRRIAEIVLEHALAAVTAWRSDGHDMHVAVNLSVSDLRDTGLPDQVLALVRRFGLPADALVLEITEGMLMADAARGRQVLADLERLGVQVAVDDFGTGYSSLAYLRELPVHELKLDRSFVSHLLTDPRAAAIVRSTVQLSHELGMVMVAEGVEDAEVQHSLATWGCDLAQGYHIARPMSGELFGQWLRTHRADRGARAAGAGQCPVAPALPVAPGGPLAPVLPLTP